MKRWAMAAVILAVSLAAHAQRSADVEVKSAWARPTVRRPDGDRRLHAADVARRRAAARRVE